MNRIFTDKIRFTFQVILCFIVLSSSFSCSKEEVENTDALNELILELKSKNTDCSCEPYLNQYTWKNKIVYVLAYKGPACSWIPVFYDSDGQMFTLPNGYNFDAFIKESSLKRTAWTCK